MAGKSFVRIDGGKEIIVDGVQVSAGSANAGDILALNALGKVDESAMPSGVGRSVIVATASEALDAGSFVNLWDDGGVLSARLADNSNLRVAHGFVESAVAQATPAAVIRLENTNAQLSSLVPATRYYLGTAGAVTDTPLEPVPANVGKLLQFLGTATSATELATENGLTVYL